MTCRSPVFTMLKYHKCNLLFYTRKKHLHHILFIFLSKHLFSRNLSFCFFWPVQIWLVLLYIYYCTAAVGPNVRTYASSEEVIIATEVQCFSTHSLKISVMTALICWLCLTYFIDVKGTWWPVQGDLWRTLKCPMISHGVL